MGIDLNSAIPYYVQLKEIIRRHIERLEWPVGQQLPGELQLCETFKVSRTVVRQALGDLTDEGLLMRRKGKGTFVAEPKLSESLVQNLTGFYQDMQERGHAPISRVLRQQVAPASDKVASQLSLAPQTHVVEIERLRFVGNEPIVLVTTYLPHSLCASLLAADLSHQSLYAFLQRECGIEIARGRRTIEARAASDYESRLLQVPKGASLIVLDSVSYLADGTPIEYYHALHRGDRSRFEVELVRIREQGGRRQILGSGLESLPRGNALVESASPPRPRAQDSDPARSPTRRIGAEDHDR